MSDQYSQEFLLLKALLEEMQKSESKSESSINTVTTLFLCLFGMIVVQKLIKYVGKPIYRAHSARTTRHNSSDDSPKTV